MVQGATQQPSKATEEVAPKPRRWFRRRGRQVFLLLLISFAVWFTWALVDGAERSDLVRKIEASRNTTVSYDLPGWVRKIEETTWLPKQLRTILVERTRFVRSFEFARHMDESIDEDLLAAFAARSWPNLTLLHSWDVSLQKEGQLLLPLGCPRLKRLDLHNSQLNDHALLSMLSHYQKLVTLKLDDQLITGQGLATLAPLSELKHLEICDCKLTSLEILDKARGLLSLSLRNTPINDELLLAIRSNVLLERLHLNGTVLKGLTLDSLRYCPKLVRLEIIRSGITDEAIQLLPALPELTYLNLIETRITGKHLFSNGVPGKLTSMWLLKTDVEFTNLIQLREHPQLDLLEVSSSKVSDDGSEILGSLPKLTDLSLDHTRIGDTCIKSILPASVLRILNVQYTNITDASGPSFRQMLSLEVLHLDHTAIGNNFIAALRGHPVLCYLYIPGTKVNDEAVSHLLTMPRLRYLTVSKGQLNPASIAQLNRSNITVDIEEERKPLK